MTILFDILRRRKRMTLKLCPLMGYHIKNIFMEKSCKKCAPKVSPRPLYNWSITQKSHCMQEILLKVRYFERGLSKRLKKGNFIFSFDPVPFNGQIFQKQKGPGTRDQSLFRLRSKFRKIPLLVMY